MDLNRFYFSVSEYRKNVELKLETKRIDGRYCKESYHMPLNYTRAAKVSPCFQSNYYDWLKRRLFPQGIDIWTPMDLKISESGDTEK